MSTPQATAMNLAMRVLVATAPNSATDQDLLRRFAVGRDEEAFAELVRRYGSLVFGVCRRILRDRSMAEDAFQATFLTLAQRAPAVGWRESVANWLYTVAHRAATRLRSAQRRQSIVPRTTPAGPPDPAEQVCLRDAMAALDEELARVPNRLREPVVLCCLQGHTCDEAASILGISVAALRRRLERGRSALAMRLQQRGLGLPAVFGAALWSSPASAVPSRLLDAAARLPFSDTVTPAVSVLAGQLARGLVLWRTGLVAGVLFAGLLAVSFAAATGGDPPTPSVPAPPESQKPAPSVAQLDQHAVPLPQGAVARFGSTQFRHAGLSDFVILPDGKAALTAGSDQMLRFWDLDTGRQTRAVKLQGIDTFGRCVALSPDGTRFAAVEESWLRVWDVDSGKELKTLTRNQSGQPTFLHFSPDGNSLVIGNDRRAVSVVEWRSDAAERVIPLTPHRIGIDSTFHAHFTPDGKQLVVGGGSEEALCVFDLKDLRMIHDLRCNAYTSVVAPNGKMLIVNCMRPGVISSNFRSFDLVSGKELGQVGLEDHYFSLAVSPDGKTIFCGASDRSCVVELATGKILHRLTSRPWGVAYTPDGKTLVASADGTRLRLWDAATGRERHDHPGNFGSHGALAVSPNGRLLASASWMTQEVSLWDTADGRLVRQLPVKGEGRYVRNLAFSHDGRRLSAAQGMGFIQFWDTATGIEQQSVQLVDSTAGNVMRGYFYQLQLSPDRKRVTALERIYSDRQERTRLGVWDGMTGKLISEQTFPGELRVWAGAGNSGIALPLANGLSVLAPDTGRVWFHLSDTSPSGPVATSADGRLVISKLKKPGMIGVWEIVTGRLVVMIETSGVDNLAVADNSRMLVTVGGGALRVWDLATGKELGRRELGGESIGLILSPDGSRAITPLADGTALAWELRAFPVAPLVTGERNVAGWWEELLRGDATAAYAAVCRMVGSPEVAVGWIREHLKSVQAPSADELRRLVTQLGADDFQTREAAERKLREHGELATAAIRETLKGNVTPEQRRRMEMLLSIPAGGTLGPGETLRGVRAVWVLERIGSPEARRVLETLGGGAADARLTREARAAVDRLGQR